MDARAQAEELLRQLSNRYGNGPRWSEWAAEDIAQSTSAVVHAAAELLTSQPELFAHDSEQFALWDNVRERLMDFLTCRAALRPDLPPAELADRVVDVLTFIGNSAGRRDAGFEEIVALLTHTPPDSRRAFLSELTTRMDAADAEHSYTVVYELRPLLGRLVKAGGPIDAPALLHWSGSHDTSFVTGLDALLTTEYEAGRPVPLALATSRRAAIARACNTRPTFLDAEPLWPMVNPGEPWADRLIADVETMPEAQRERWTALLVHATDAHQPRPSARWRRTGAALLAEVGTVEFTERMHDWLTLVGRPRSVPLRAEPFATADPNQTLDAYNVLVLRGLLWLLATCPPSETTARRLGAVVETALRKVVGLGPRSPKLANAAVHALSQLDDPAAVGQLARLSARVTHKGTMKELEKALNARAEALGISRDEIDELSVPSYGLTEVGGRAEKFGPARVELRITGNEAKLHWYNAAGRAVKSPPAEVRREHGEALAELKAAVKDIGKMLTAQRERLDRMALARRSWRFAAWRERYLDHPLVGTLARRLIWTVDGTACCWAGGVLRTVDDTVLDPATDAVVELWHPIGQEVPVVLAWREFLERHGITQPFKQAHREVYLLTDAERRTRVYSNRFAAHILRQHQFHALTAARGWRDTLRLMVDDMYPPASRELPEWDLRAEYWVEGIGDDYGTDTTDSGTYLHLATDQIRFYADRAPTHLQHGYGSGYERSPGQEPDQPVPLAEVPALVLSEVLRDVDLFVGVASVGNDPTWSDGGPQGLFRDYWHSYSFGELTATARTRRDLLSRLLPRLAIGQRCELSGRFLLVRGDLGTYKIHLGSGNVLMAPHDEYLCIVPDRSSRADTGGMFLPFEGDRTLSLVLSKAFLLADDTAITDGTILSQLRRARSAHT